METYAEISYYSNILRKNESYYFELDTYYLSWVTQFYDIIIF